MEGDADPDPVADPVADPVVFKYSRLDFALTVLGLFFFLADVVLDVLAAVRFYRCGDFVYLGLLVVLLVGSSVLGQVYSWLWYRYDDYQRHTWTERSVDPVGLRVLHLLQLGVYLRYVGVLEVAVHSFCSKRRAPQGQAVHLSHDLALLRLIESFSESAPQLVLMQTVLLHTGEWRDPVTVLKALGSASAIACSVTRYHRSLRSFLPTRTQGFGSSLLYFTWNLLLIFPRVAALTLFAYTLPCYVFVHFLCWWAVLFFAAWYSKASLMDCAAGEWLYQATVGLIWYFSWFNVAEGRTLSHCALYHTWMLLDMGLLCGLACWRTTTHDAPWPGGNGATALPLDTVSIMSGCIGAVYLTGLLVKILYYKFCHHTLPSGEPEGLPSAEDLKEPLRDSVVMDVTDDAGQAGTGDVETDAMHRSAPRREKKEHKKQPENRRMKRLAQNFYS